MTGVLYGVGLVLVSSVTFLLAILGPWQSGEEFRQELVKVGIQVVVFGLVGGGVKLLLDREAEDRRFRSDILERLGRAHQELYRIRRLLPGANTEEKQALLVELMNARQELGSTSHAVRGGSFGPEVLDQIRDEMEKMRDYLEAVINGGLAPKPHETYENFTRWQNDNGEYEDGFKKAYVKVKGLVDPSFREWHEKRQRAAGEKKKRSQEKKRAKAKDEESAL